MIAPDTELRNEDNALMFAIEANEYYLASNVHMAYLNLNVALTFALLIGDAAYGILNVAAKKLETEICNKTFACAPLFDVSELMSALKKK
jgi:hypothetical protein